MRTILLVSALALLFFSRQTFAQTFYRDARVNEIVGLVDSLYVDPVNIDSIAQLMITADTNDADAIKKLLHQLDPHSNFLTAAEYTEFKNNLSAKFQGVGLQFTIYRDTIVIIQVFANGPAERGGVQTGDKLLSIDDSLISGRGMSYGEIISRLRGPRGTSVRVGVQRDGVRLKDNLLLVRDEITLTSIDAAYMLDDRIGYIRLSSFTNSSADEFRNALRNLVDRGMNHLVLDLRDNTGGLMSAAVAIADEFLSERKTIVTVRGSNESDERFSEKPGLFENKRMAVLVNGATVSSAEILTGALQDNNRATIVGTRTYGKGLVQKVIPLSDSATAILLTIARYYTPSGKCIQRPYNDGSKMYYEDFNTSSMHTGETPESFRDTTWGIHPDIFIAEDTTAAHVIADAFRNRFYMEEFVYGNYANNRFAFAKYKSPDDLRKNWSVSNAMFQEFNSYVAVQEGRLPPDQQIKYSQADLAASRPKIETMMTAFIAHAKWGNEGMYVVLNREDNAIRQAVKN